MIRFATLALALVLVAVPARATDSEEARTTLKGMTGVEVVVESVLDRFKQSMDMFVNAWLWANPKHGWGSD